jgi:hypothetical protein
MRSMFVSAPFTRYDLGRQALSGGQGLPRVQLGISADYLKDIANVSDADSRAKLKAQYDDCNGKSGTSQIVCFASLAASIYKESQNSAPTSALTPVLPPPPASSFPVIPVLVATLGAGALIWFLVSRGKK